MPLLNLADWDRRKTNNSPNDKSNPNGHRKQKGEKRVDRQEEKKDSIDEYQRWANALMPHRSEKYLQTDRKILFQ